MPDWKHPKRVRLRGSAYRQLHTQIVHGKRCVICGEWARTMHHLLPRSHGGEDVPENLIPVCGDGTRGCHSDIEERREGAREKVRATLLPCHIDYLARECGWGWIDRQYPLPSDGPKDVPHGQADAVAVHGQ